MRHTDQHPMTRTHTGYTRPQHTRNHWQGNRPADCAWCEYETGGGVGTGAGGEADPATTEATSLGEPLTDCPEAPAQAHTPTSDDEYPGAIAAAMFAIPAVLTALFAVLALIHGMAGAWINGYTVLAILTLAVTGVIGALTYRSNP